MAITTAFFFLKYTFNTKLVLNTVLGSWEGVQQLIRYNSFAFQMLMD